MNINLKVKQLFGAHTGFNFADAIKQVNAAVIDAMFRIGEPPLDLIQSIDVEVAPLDPSRMHPTMRVSYTVTLSPRVFGVDADTKPRSFVGPIRPTDSWWLNALRAEDTTFDVTDGFDVDGFAAQLVGHTCAVMKDIASSQKQHLAGVAQIIAECGSMAGASS